VARQMEIRPVAGLAEILWGSVLQSASSRMVVPDAETLETVTRIGNAFIAEQAKQPEHQGTTIYTAFQWPERGPIALAFVWAINTRQPVEPKTGNPFFFRAYSETQEPHEHLLTVAQMEEQLAEYSLSQFGRPTPV